MSAMPEERRVFRAPSLQPRPPKPPQTDERPALHAVARSMLTIRQPSPMVDKSFKALIIACAGSLFAIVALILVELIIGSKLSLHQFGFHFFAGSIWDPVAGDFGALP